MSKHRRTAALATVAVVAGLQSPLAAIATSASEPASVCVPGSALCTSQTSSSLRRWL